MSFSTGLRLDHVACMRGAGRQHCVSHLASSSVHGLSGRKSAVRVLRGRESDPLRSEHRARSRLSVARSEGSAAQSSLTDTHGWQRLSAIAAVMLSMACSSSAALAATHPEPANALSVPTWVIHISSVIEWTTAMLLMWRYAEVTGNEKWKGMTWGMMPLFAGALCACTYHFFYNSPELDFLVSVQASLTWIGNATLWAAAYRIFKDSKSAVES